MRFARGMVFGMTLAIGILKADPVCAENQGKLPEIASWQNGFGYQEDGTQITGGWAYDMVNPAGRYVQFGEDGSVIQKTENPDTIDMEENYTGTELVPATLAIRAELFDGFSGTVTVLVEGSGGIQRTVELRQDNFYGLNIPVNSGDYRVIKAEARDEIHSYVTQFPDSIVHLSEKGAQVLKIQVMDQVTKEAETTGEQIEQASEEVPEKGNHALKTEQMEEEKGGVRRKMGAKRMAAICGSIGGLCLAGILLLRKKRKKYS